VLAKEFWEQYKEYLGTAKKKGKRH
jgi:hypothetical protein